MALKTDVLEGVRRTLKTQLKIRDGRTVPEKQDLTFLNGGGAVRLDATYAYADMADSSGLAQRIRPDVAANIMRAYVQAAAKVFRAYGGQIRSFDGDRVMAIFVGDQKNALAVRAALALNWTVDKVLNPLIVETWSDISKYWGLRHGVGVATGDALIVRGGVFGDSDMISVGGAPNIAAKLSDERPTAFQPPYSLFITEEVYKDLPDPVRLGRGLAALNPYYLAGFQRQPQLVDMWDALGQRSIGGAIVWIRGSTFEWEPE